MANNNLDNFLAMMNTQAALSSGQKVPTKKLGEKIFCAHPDNQGTYQVVPFNNPVTGYPFVTMYDTKEVNIRAEFTKDNVKQVTDVWHKILPKDAYVMKDSTGRTVSSLSREDDILWETANKLWRDLYGELGGYKKSVDKTPEDQKNIASLLRTKNYTLFNAYCLARLGDKNRGTVREKFTALFVIPAKGFMDNVKQNIDQLTQFDYNGDNTWMTQIYNDNTASRNGYMLFTITRPQTVYQVVISHKVVNQPINMEISEDDLAFLSKSPVENFLGKMAHEEPDTVPAFSRKLFNRAEYERMISYMTNMLAAIRTNKAQGASVADAIINTTNLALQQNAVTTAPIQGSVDPMLQQMTAQPSVNAENIVQNNTTPFQNPPAAHIDPITGNAVNFNGGTTFGATGTNTAATSAPFSSPFGQQPVANDDDLPF